jgi:hypothetical protein
MDCPMPNAECRMLKRPYGRRGGFSFTEILFAVMILGIGFIMIAAMFPVAIRQTEAGSQETIAAAVGRTSSNYLGELAAMPLPAGVLLNYTPPGSSQLPSILLPTVVQTTATTPPTVQLPPATSFMLPASQSTMVVPGQVWTLLDSRDPWVYTWPGGGTSKHNMVLWQSIARNLILPGDMRFGYAVMYRRDAIVRGKPSSPGSSIAPATFAQIIVIGMQCRTKQSYDPTPTTGDLNPAPPANIPPTPFIPRPAGALVNSNGTSTGKGVLITLPAYTGGPSYLDFGNVGGFPPMLADNAYVVISDDNVPWGKPSHGSLNGRIFRVGTAPTSGTAWQLLPGSDVTTSDLAALTNMQTDLGGVPQFNVLIVGRTPTVSGGMVTFTGPAQDVTAYTTYLPIAN